MLDEIRIGFIGRSVTFFVTREHLFDLAIIAPTRLLEPARFSVGGRYSRQPADTRIRHISARELRLQGWSLSKLAGDAQLLLCGARRVTEHVFEIFERMYIAERAPDVLGVGASEPTGFLGVETRALLG